MTSNTPAWILVVCSVGLAAGAYAGPPPEPATAPTIDPELLAGIEDRAPVRGADQNEYESRLYHHMLVEARRTPIEAFARSARRDLTFAHLFEEPARHRGQVVHIEGRLKRLRQFDAPALAAAQGVPVIYEGWIFDDAYFSNPYCVLVTNLPAGLQPAERMELLVAFDGYFFKRYRYKAGDGWRDAPLLIGHSLRLRPAPGPTPADSFSQVFLPAFLGLLGGSVALAVFLGWWFRRGDRLVRARLGSVQAPPFVPPGEHLAAPKDNEPPTPNGATRRTETGA